MFLTVPYFCWLSLTVSQVPWSHCMSVTVSHGCWLPLTVSPSAMELLYFSHFLLCSLGFSHCLFQCNGVASCLTVCYGLWPSLTVSTVPWCWYMSLILSSSSAACLSLFLMVAGLLSLSIKSHGVASCLSLSPMLYDCF